MVSKEKQHLKPFCSDNAVTCNHRAHMLFNFPQFLAFCGVKKGANLVWNKEQEMNKAWSVISAFSAAL